MRGLRIILSASALLAGVAMAPAARAQVAIEVGIQPVCSYGYYDYAPYECAPMGFYGPGYFYQGIFLGMGPWAGWGYGHGWGSHRFSESGGGRYNGGGGAAAAHGAWAGNRGGDARGDVRDERGSRAPEARGRPSAATARTSAPRNRPAPAARPTRTSAPRSAAPRATHAAAPRATRAAAPRASAASHSSRPAEPSGGARSGGGEKPREN
jgi:pyruvate/2-oxoglutarate dehydrogenase complex dihydrolipoamide acyltransferase (E2) component